MNKKNYQVWLSSILKKAQGVSDINVAIWLVLAFILEKKYK